MAATAPDRGDDPRLRRRRANFTRRARMVRLHEKAASATRCRRITIWRSAFHRWTYCRRVIGVRRCGSLPASFN